MSNLSLLYAFIGGAIVGAGAAVLFAPERVRISVRVSPIFSAKGIICSDNEIDALVEQLTTEIDD